MSFFKGYDEEEISVQIQTTSVCTARCVMCPYTESWHKKNPGTMSDHVFDRILEQIADFKIKKICPYLENEPLADNKIFERIAKIRKLMPKAVIEVSTNALALTKINIKKLLNALDGGPHDIWISFHGIDKRTHDGIMGVPFEQCHANVVNLLLESNIRDLKIHIRGAGRGRVDELNHEFCFEEEAYKSFWNETLKKYNIAKKPVIEFFTYHDRAGSIHRNSINLQKIIRPQLDNFNCRRLSNWLHFLYTGELILCCMDYHRETVFGDITKQDLTEIMNGEKFRELGDSLTGKCKSENDFICKRCISPGG